MFLTKQHIFTPHLQQTSSSSGELWSSGGWGWMNGCEEGIERERAISMEQMSQEWSLLSHLLDPDRRGRIRGSVDRDGQREGWGREVNAWRGGIGKVSNVIRGVAEAWSSIQNQNRKKTPHSAKKKKTFQKKTKELDYTWSLSSKQKVKVTLTESLHQTVQMMLYM